MYEVVGTYKTYSQEKIGGEFIECWEETIVATFDDGDTARRFINSQQLKISNRTTHVFRMGLLRNYTGAHTQLRDEPEIPPPHNPDF